jgi:Phage integrase family
VRTVTRPGRDESAALTHRGGRLHLEPGPTTHAVPSPTNRVGRRLTTWLHPLESAGRLRGDPLRRTGSDQIGWWTCLSLSNATSIFDSIFRLADAAAQYPISDVGEQYRALVLVLAFCGLRWGEAAGLKVGRLDLLRRRLTVAETLSEVRGHLVWGTPKSHAARSVPIPGFLVDLLADITKSAKHADLVFTTWRGMPLRNLNFRRDVFDLAAADVGLAGLTPHELRHTAASFAVSAGANVKAVQRMLGHASAAMTLDVYSGLFDDDLDGVAERLNEARPAEWYPSGTRDTGAEVIELRKGS